MKRLAGILALWFTFGTLLFATDAKTLSATGWITDEKCAAMHGGGPGHAACARKCIESGITAVFVGDEDKKVIKIENQDAVKKLAGEHVKIEGTLDSDGKLHVDKVAKLSASK